MRLVKVLLMAGAVSLLGATHAQESIWFDFNGFNDGPIDGQMGWNVYEKVADSSALSIKDQLGTSEEKGDKALVVRSSREGIRCVTGEPVRWLPGRTMTVKFDFKLALGPEEIYANKPVLTVLVGDSLLGEKARFSLQLEALMSGDWRLVGRMPDEVSKPIYAENFIFRHGSEMIVSQWYSCELILEKKREPDSFDVRTKVVEAQTGKELVALQFTDDKKNKLVAEVWNTSRAHVGFQATANQFGIVCIDNLTISSAAPASE